MFQEQLIKYCSPTLAGIKTGNIFNYFADSEIVNCTLKEYNLLFNQLGLEFVALNEKPTNTLIYVYRREKLINDFKNPELNGFIKLYGYDSENIDFSIQKLKSRIVECDSFPHEIGIFLSYPIQDIKGFIHNRGSNFKCNGYWKVYDNEQSAKKSFTMYEKCTNVYSQLFKAGKGIEQLLVI